MVAGSSTANAETSSQDDPELGAINVLQSTINTMAVTEFPDSYAGIGGDIGGLPVLYVTDGPSAATLRAQAMGISDSMSVPLKIEQRPHSIAELNKLSDQIQKDSVDLKSMGIVPTRWGRDTELDKVVIHLQNHTQDAAEILVSRYGSDLISVSTQDMPMAKDLLSRTADSAPWTGGAAIWFDSNTPVLDCSSGFGYKGKATGNAYMLTAGHCGGSTAHTNNNHNYTMGPVTNTIVGGGRVDVETIRTTGGGSGRVLGKNTTYGIKGAFEPGTNYQYVTVSGAKTGEVNNARVYAIDQCITTESGNACHQTFIYKNGTTLCQGGDSGGPVFQRLSTGGAKAVGIIKATDGIGGCYYSQILDVLGAVNGQITTS